MQAMPETKPPSAPAGHRTVLEVTVNNHPGVMSHVCGLFARRAYNLEGILCMPIEDGSVSRMWLLVDEEHRLEQVVRQLMKLADVIRVERHAAGHEVFVRLERFFQGSGNETAAGVQ